MKNFRHRAHAHRKKLAKGRPCPSNAVSATRQAESDHLHRYSSKIQSSMKLYDFNHSGKLEPDQIRRLLTDVGLTTPAGIPPTDEEIDFILSVSDHEGDHCLYPSELEYALRAWSVYTEKREALSEALKNFDRSATGTLNKDELANYLRSLNGGIDVPEEEVAWVLREADVYGDGEVRHATLILATSVWYCHVQKSDTFTFHAHFDEQVDHLGFEVCYTNPEPSVGGVLPDGDAGREGVHTGDVLTELNGIKTKDKHRNELLPLLKMRPLSMTLRRRVVED